MIVMRDKFTWAFFIFTKQLWTTRPLSVSLRASSLFWIEITWLLLLPLSSFTEQSWTDLNFFSILLCSPAPPPPPPRQRRPNNTGKSSGGSQIFGGWILATVLSRIQVDFGDLGRKVLCLILIKYCLSRFQIMAFLS